ncbi:glycosyltransferase family 4 protein [Collimonas antrihumi]|uniref:glycosyltransferase family 4 protein n=1 Tax=Collimonas antrihumi TaxID=1940615 RepID=UPI001B8A988F|nr:glycosyltransferase family 4 protein [Collimonas antrihumi]
MVFFVGPLPPPLHGFSAINQKMLTRLLDRTDVRIFDTTPKHLSDGNKWQLFFKIFHWLRSFCLFIFLMIVRRPNALYLGMSGGPRQLFDSLYILISRLFGSNIFVHHHSFAYLNAIKPYNRICMWLAGRSCHIVLCDVMAGKLAAAYGIPEEQIFILSNAAFLDEEGRFQNRPEISPDGLTLGFISNITVEKGIVEFFDVVAGLVQQGLQVKGVIAGPVDPALQKQFSGMLAGRNDIEYLGPVYGEKKDAFFQSIDLLLFPTKYQNEAEPVTILEALRDGVPVVAAGRGCIHSMIDQRSGAVFPNIDQYVADATEYIKSVMTGSISLNALSENAFNQFSAMRTCNVARLDDLITKIAGPKQLTI